MVARVRLTSPVQFLALGFGSGLSPRAPGTVGSLAALPVISLMQWLPLEGYLLVTLLAAVAGVYLCGSTARQLGVDDHPAIVWDEMVGMMLTFTAIPFSWPSVVLGFVLFRFFDIIKPGPVRWCDNHLHGGIGIMADDVLAGLAAWLILFPLTQWII